MAGACMLTGMLIQGHPQKTCFSSHNNSHWSFVPGGSLASVSVQLMALRSQDQNSTMESECAHSDSTVTEKLYRCFFDLEMLF